MFIVFCCLLCATLLCLEILLIVHKWVQVNADSKCHVYSEKGLDNYVYVTLKKRKTNENNIKNSNSMTKYPHNFSYRQFKLGTSFSLIHDVKYSKNMLFPEKQIYDNSYTVDRILSSGVYSNSAYRTIRSRVVILEIAKAYVFLSLNAKGFDMVSHFKSLSRKYVVYKKEIQILPKLVKYFFALEIKRAYDELADIKRIICLAKRKQISFKKSRYSDAEVYALLMYSKEFYAVALRRNIDVNACVLRLSKRMLELNSKIKRCFLWINAL